MFWQSSLMLTPKTSRRSACRSEQECLRPTGPFCWKRTFLTIDYSFIILFNQPQSLCMCNLLLRSRVSLCVELTDKKVF